ncbi:single-stranded DNA-binding protein [Tersicoccus sp. MR15.9]|uniref:single-stranded DNA-binding protein n=1 Tax=Tersicoccus mangrovi TaxID=3121635 RepID=UPI002FE5C8FE
MSETITVVGNIGSDVTGSTTAKGDAITSFRLASTERWLDRQTGAWVDGATNWYSVVCFRNLARNAGCSLAKGQPVVVTGRLKVRPWERDGKSGTNVQIEADSIGHNLRLGTTNFRGGATGNERPPAGVDAATGEIVDDAAGPRGGTEVGADDGAFAHEGGTDRRSTGEDTPGRAELDAFEEAEDKQAVPF